MKYKVNDKLEIEVAEFKSYKVNKLVKLALLNGVVVKDGITPSIPASNAIQSEEVLLLQMTNLTQEQLDGLTEKEGEELLKKINSFEIVPGKDS